MTTATKETVEQEQYLTFLLGGEEYAIGILKVKEIIEYDTVTTVAYGMLGSWLDTYEQAAPQTMLELSSVAGVAF
jgi:hypothetical protein